MCVYTNTCAWMRSSTAPVVVGGQLGLTFFFYTFTWVWEFELKLLGLQGKHFYNRVTSGFLFYIYLYEFECMFANHMCVGAYRSQKGALNSLVLKLQSAISHLIWVLRTKPVSSARAKCNSQASFQAPYASVFKTKITGYIQGLLWD